MDFKEHIIEKIVDITGLEREVVEKSVEVPPDEKMGDIAFPCFPLAKVMRKAPPIIAQELAEKMSGDDMIEKAQAAGGYLNFFLNREKFISETVSSALDAGEDWGKSDMGKGKTVLVEYSSPNIAKPFHIGHLFSTAVGNSLSKIYKHLGYDVQSLNHLGDWGTQFGKLICAYKRWGVKEVIEKDPINELLKIYVKFHEEAEKHPELDDEARGYFKKLEDGDEETTALWTYFRDISLVEFKRVYDMLGVKFDSYNGEAFYSDKMDEVVDILRDKGLLTESDGAQVVDLSELNIPPCIVLKSDGATIYATRDIAAALYRHRTYDFYKNIYVVGIPQSLHFKQIFAVMKKAGWDWADDCVHVGFGLVKLPGKNMSTRHGDVVFLEDVLNDQSKRLRKLSRKTAQMLRISKTRQRKSVSAQYFIHSLKIRVKRILYSVGILCLTLRVSLLRIVSTVMRAAEVF